MIRTHRILLVIGLITVWLAGLAAQRKTKPLAQEAPQVPRAVFRAGTEYVAVDVVVTGPHDQPVTDLTAADFEIREKGRVQTVRDFEHISVPIVRGVVDLKAPPAPRPDVATNTPVSPSTRAFVVLIDDGAVQLQNLAKLKRVMTEFLETLSPDDRVAIVHTGRSDLSQDFTSDFGLLVRTVNNIKAALGFSKDARASRIGLSSVIAALAAVPETRRVLVYVSSGFGICDPMDPGCAGLDFAVTKGATGGPPQLFTPRGLQDVIDRARAAAVPIYAIDPGGLLAPDLNLGARLEDQTPQNRHAADVTSQMSQDFMRSLPENTGGLAFTNTNELVPAVDAIMTENSNYYVLGYSPSPYVADDRFHQIEVRVVTRPGLHVHARAGYVATHAASAPDPHQRLLDAIGEPQPHSDLGVRAFVAPVSAAPRGATAIVTVDIAYPSASGDIPRVDDDLQIAFVAIDPDGRIKTSAPRAVHVGLAQARRQALTLSLDDTLDLPRGKWMLRIGVSSRVLGTVGTVHLPVNIPDLSASGPATSPVVLGLAAGATEVVGRPDAIAALVPFQPTTQRSFSSAQQVRVFARMFPSKSTASIAAELRVLRGTRTLRTAPMRVTTSPAVGSGRDCLATLSLDDLPPGSYALQLAVRASQGSVRSPDPVGILVTSTAAPGRTANLDVSVRLSLHGGM